MESTAVDSSILGMVTGFRGDKRFSHNERAVNFVLGIYKPEGGDSTIGNLRGVGEVVELTGNDITKIWRLEAPIDSELLQCG